MGVLTAEVYDYNEVGFTEGGVHTRTHYFTMVCGSDGRYRFVSKRSQIIDPAQVSVEGYFLSIGQIGEITPEIEAEFALTQAGILDGNILLYHIQHTASGYQMYLYGVNPRTGGVIRSAEIPEQPESSALLRAEVTADGTGVLVFAEDRVILLDSRLSQVEELVLPEEAQGLEYDCSDDGEQLCYVDDTGLWLLRTEDTEPILLAAHPTQPEGERRSVWHRSAVYPAGQLDPGSGSPGRAAPCTIPGMTWMSWKKSWRSRRTTAGRTRRRTMRTKRLSPVCWKAGGYPSIPGQ